MTHLVYSKNFRGQSIHEQNCVLKQAKQKEREVKIHELLIPLQIVLHGMTINPWHVDRIDPEKNLDLGASQVAGRGTPSRAQKGTLVQNWGWEISFRGDIHADKARDFIVCVLRGWVGGVVPRWRLQGNWSPGELLCHVARGPAFYCDGVSF